EYSHAEDTGMMRRKLSGGMVIASLLFATALTAGGPDTRLMDAAKEKDTAAVRSLLQQKVDVNTSAPDGATALHWAAHMNDMATAQLLVSAGANVRASNLYGVTPLSLACTNGAAAMIELLLKAGADPNTTMPEGETALMTAARTGNVDALEALLSHGAGVNTKESWRGQTALMWAAGEGHAAAVERLIEAGADIRARSNGGFTPLLFAVREGQSAAVRVLVKAGADVNETLPARNRPRRNGASGSAGTKTGLSALDLAVANAHFELAAVLLDAGADPNAAGPGWTPLHTITWVRKPGKGSNDPAPPGSGNMDSLELVRRLAAKGADLNARMTSRTPAGASSLNMIGATPFLMAARTGDAELMRLLAELGADPLLPNEDNTTPFIVAAGVGTRSPGEDAGTESEVLAAVKVALELGNDINAVDKHGETAMHGAAYKHLPSVVQFLASNGARLEIWNRKNDLGWTPLRIAEGVHRTLNFRSSPPTAAVLRKLMSAAGVPTVVEPETVISGSTR
ncbi:MAG: ankyrin repeat domain-containing protein, partial [Bryobacteraceae bacterium]